MSMPVFLLFSAYAAIFGFVISLIFSFTKRWRSGGLIGSGCAFIAGLLVFAILLLFVWRGEWRQFLVVIQFRVFRAFSSFALFFFLIGFIIYLIGIVIGIMLESVNPNLKRKEKYLYKMNISRPSVHGNTWVDDGWWLFGGEAKNF